MPAADEQVPEPLRAAQFVALTTYRRDGTPVSTPLGPLVQAGRVYFITRSDTGKVKRLRRNSQVQLAPCTRRGEVTGPIYPGTARVLADEEAAEIAAAFRRNWGWQWHAMRLVDRFAGKRRVYLEVSPSVA
jgi:PPOX class probable F420-dependent enzyme